MNREVHVRFWESAGLRCPAPLDYLHAFETGSEFVCRTDVVDQLL